MTKRNKNQINRRWM